ncbi:MAG: hypothetical protein ABH869_05960 [Candidatus Omnitrophota bacterium]
MYFFEVVLDAFKYNRVGCVKTRASVNKKKARKLNIDFSFGYDIIYTG